MGDTVELGSNVDLIFDYNFPPSFSLANLKSKELEEARLNDIDIGVTVIPSGFSARNQDGSRWYKTAQFKDGNLIEQVRFEFYAAESIPLQLGSNNNSDAQEAVCGFHIVLDVMGLVINSFFLPVKLVESLPNNVPSAIYHPLVLDLDNLNKRISRFKENFGLASDHA